MDLINSTRLIGVAKSIIEISKEVKSNPTPEKSGGYLTLALDNFEVRYVLSVGEYPKEKRDKYFRLSQEKAHRLYAHWLRFPETAVSSFQTMDPEVMQYGGGVLFRNGSNKSLANIISFSGLDALADESVSLLLGDYLGLAEKELFERVTEISGNNLFYEMLDRFKSKRAE